MSNKISRKNKSQASNKFQAQQSKKEISNYPKKQPKKIEQTEKIEVLAPKSLPNRIVHLFTPTWLHNSYTILSPYIGFDKQNFRRTSLLAISVMLECTKNYFLYLYFYTESKKSLEEIISNKPVDPIALKDAFQTFSTSILFSVAAGSLSDVCLRKSIDSLVTRMKEHWTKEWIHSGVYNGKNYLSLKKTDHLDPSLVLNRDISLFVTSTMELFDSFSSIASSTLAAITIFWGTLDMQVAFYCLGILAILKIAFSIIGQSLKDYGQEQKSLEERFMTDLCNANKQSESIELCQGRAFETQILNEYLYKAEAISNKMSDLAGIINFVAELATYGSFALGVYLCMDKIISGSLILPDVISIGVAITALVNAALWAEKNMQLIVRAEVSYKGLEWMRSIKDKWFTTIEKRNEDFEIGKTENTVKIAILVRDTKGNIIFNTIGDPLELKSGLKYQITGPSGSGKSTLIRAIAGIWPYVEGKLEIPENTCIVPQYALIRGSNTTLLDIIRYPKTSEAIESEVTEIEQLMQLFKLEKYIGLLRCSSWQEKGPSTKTTETVEALNFYNTLSGGEKQRLALVSAIIKKPRFLVLDEATCAIDEDTNAIIDQVMGDKLSKSIILFVKHNADSSKVNTPRTPKSSRELKNKQPVISNLGKTIDIIPWGPIKNSVLNAISEAEDS